MRRADARGAGLRDVQPVRIALPTRPDEPAPYSFPLIATLAPVVASVALWLVTGSLFALLFAALGPVIAIGSLADSRLQGRRTRRRGRQSFERDVAATERAIDAQHAVEREELHAAAPSAARVGSAVDPDRWSAGRRSGDGPRLPVLLGRGLAPSGLQLEGAGPRAGEPDEFDEALAALRRRAERVEDAPLVADACQGVGLVGPDALTRPMRRALALQLAGALPPDRYELEGVEGWGIELPHRVTIAEGDLIARERASGQPAAVVSSAPSASGLAPHCRVVVDLRQSSRLGRVVAHPDRALVGDIVPAFLDEESAAAAARALAEAAERAGLGGADREPPSAVLLDDLVDVDHRSDRSSLRAVLGRGADDPLEVDLVADGPHAVLAGTTGAGKSELLVSWVVALAAAYPPDRVTFLLVDFKGGAAFRPLEGLPHCVGVITDLDEASAQRAFESLTAELRHRERVLAASGCRSIDDLASQVQLPRLVLVVDEYAALVSGFPDLHGLIADLAARGRSLGLHLVLCTQRPSGVVRDAVLANTGLRMSLRVNDASDSMSVLGVTDAATLPAEPRGRVLVRRNGGALQTAQVGIASSRLVESVTEAGRLFDRPRRPWCEPLPAVLQASELPSGPGVVLGLRDLPAQQRQETLSLDMSHGRHLLVVGGARSGKTTVLHLVGAQAGAARASGLEAIWDTVTAALEHAAAPLVLLDDLDAVLARCGPDHAVELADRVARLLREGSSRGVGVIATAQRLTGALQSLLPAFDDRLVLRLADRAEHVALVGSATAWDPHAVPGRGHWRGTTVQLALPAEEPVLGAGLRHEPPQLERPLAIVTVRPAQLARALVEHGLAYHELDPAASSDAITVGRATGAVVGHPEAWRSAWSAFAAVRGTHDVLFDGCTASDLRAITGERRLPPPLEDPARTGWLLSTDGRLRRATVPLPGEGA